MYGYDGGKLVKGRKRHQLARYPRFAISSRRDRSELPRTCRGCSCGDGSGARPVNLQVIWVDQGYQGENFSRVIQALCGAEVEVIKRTEPGFQVLPKRWIVERTFGWLNYSLASSKDYELLPEVSEAMIYTAITRLMLRRLAKQHSSA